MKKKSFYMGIGLCIVIAGIAGICIIQGINDSDDVPLKPVEGVISDSQLVDESLYKNLQFHDFKIVTNEINGVYEIEILSNDDYLERTFLENFQIMSDVIDKFFGEDFDKSYVVADFYPPDEDTIYVSYDDIPDVCTDEKYNTSDITYLFGNNTKEGGYMVQIDERLTNVWFSKYGLKDIMPSQLDCEKVYTYLSCIRQTEDVEISLQDGKIMLSQLEENVLSFLNEEFPMEVSENISFGIGDVRIIKNGDCEGVCFKVRRIYKGIPFEYGSGYADGMYIDDVDHERGEVSYSVSSSPDTMLAFSRVNGTVIETKKITKMLSAEQAIQIVAEKIGENSTYDVHGMELVYRACDIPEERKSEVDAIMRPCWKLITINQNDSKYTLFYVDVETGEVTERFEYYYE